MDISRLNISKFYGDNISVLDFQDVDDLIIKLTEEFFFSIFRTDHIVLKKIKKYIVNRLAFLKSFLSDIAKHHNIVFYPIDLVIDVPPIHKTLLNRKYKNEMKILVDPTYPNKNRSNMYKKDCLAIKKIRQNIEIAMNILYPNCEEKLKQKLIKYGQRL